MATLTEVAAILAAPPTGDGKRTTGDLLQQAITIASDASSTQKPTQEQVQAAFQSLATKLETKVKDDFKAAGVAPPAEVKIVVKEIDLTPPETTANHQLSAVSRKPRSPLHATKVLARFAARWTEQLFLFALPP